MNFQVVALDATKFRALYGLNKETLARRGVERHTVTETPGFPCRVSLIDCDVGDSVLLLNFEHHPSDTPYRSSHAIFVRDGAETAKLEKCEVPKFLRIRTLSVRAFKNGGSMLDADITNGEDLGKLIQRFFRNSNVEYLHVHNAGRGCYNAKVIRA